MTTNQNGAQSATKTPSRPGEFSEQLDPGLMQHEIYRQFVERFVEVADETSLTAADQLGMRLVIYAFRCLLTRGNPLTQPTH
jgi:hypothetical protein